MTTHGIIAEGIAKIIKKVKRKRKIKKHLRDKKLISKKKSK
jgi:hypothetical protein